MFYILFVITMINNESYVVIWGWMLNNLKLKWNELVAYATIYSFTNGTDEHCYKWSAGYLAERCWIDKRSALRILQKLEEKWLIFRNERIENWVKFVDYYTNVMGSDKMSLGGSDKMSPHNNRIDNYSNNTHPEVQGYTIPKNKNSITGKKISALDIIKNSDDVRDILSDDDIVQYKVQLKILLKMIELGYKVNKSKEDIEKELERLKAKAKLYWLIQWDGNIAWQTFYQKIDKRYDWHTEKWKPVKNFKTSIIPFISK